MFGINFRFMPKFRFQETLKHNNPLHYAIVNNIRRIFQNERNLCSCLLTQSSLCNKTLSISRHMIRLRCNLALIWKQKWIFETKIFGCSFFYFRIIIPLLYLLWTDESHSLAANRSMNMSKWRTTNIYKAIVWLLRGELFICEWDIACHAFKRKKLRIYTHSQSMWAPQWVSTARKENICLSMVAILQNLEIKSAWKATGTRKMKLKFNIRHFMSQRISNWIFLYNIMKNRQEKNKKIITFYFSRSE